MIKILIADAQPMVRKGLRMQLTTEPDFVIVGEAADGVEAEEMMIETDPDVVILDAEIPKRDGYSTARSLRKVNPEIAVILLSLRGDPSSRSRAKIVGADAFVEKHAGVESLLNTIRQIKEIKGAKYA